MKLAQSPRQWSYQKSMNRSKRCTQYSLIHNDTHSIVKQTLAKYDGIKLGINFILVENCQNGDRIRGRESGTKN